MLMSRKRRKQSIAISSVIFYNIATLVKFTCASEQEGGCKMNTVKPATAEKVRATWGSIGSQPMILIEGFNIDTSSWGPADFANFQRSLRKVMNMWPHVIAVDLAIGENGQFRRVLVRLSYYAPDPTPNLRGMAYRVREWISSLTK
jgi:hypothetical protein